MKSRKNIEQNLEKRSISREYTKADAKLASPITKREN